jgi:hypothetical protein
MSIWYHKHCYFSIYLVEFKINLPDMHLFYNQESRPYHPLYSLSGRHVGPMANGGPNGGRSSIHSVSFNPPIPNRNIDGSALHADSALVAVEV